jgi:hypothetical protein
MQLGDVFICVFSMLGCILMGAVFMTIFFIIRDGE